MIYSKTLKIKTTPKKYDDGYGFRVDFYVDSQYIGTASVADFNAKKNNFLHSVAVEDEFQNMGYGKQIIQCMISMYQIDTLYVETENIIAINLYQKFGFVVTDSFAKNNKFVVMERVLE